VSGSFVLVAGGTGGHLFPAEALAAELIGHGRQVRLLTDSRVAAFAADLPGIEVTHLKIGRLGGGPIHTARGLTELAAGSLQSRRLLRRLRPAAVIGFGGYPSLPTMLAAVSLGLPTLIHEQNAILGRANRLLAPLVRRIATGFPDTDRLRRSDRARAVHTGNPVRAAILALGSVPYTAPRPDQPIELLILGGSQGAHILGAVVPAALAMLPQSLRERLRVGQQARPEDREAVVGAYAQAGICAQVERFFSDVPQRLARAHLAICRAGASTIGELAAVGRPAVLVPYPFATDDHQTANTRAIAAAGGARLIVQSELRAESLAANLEKLLGDGTALVQMAQHALAFGRRDAARHLASLALALEHRTALQECAA
jgi:UDP-N-acetylglucosamine--N-acetylmuramyl-(pentapeptide) pyrophosphoryl-undecaprenol N-acetylglucosamine transferase